MLSLAHLLELATHYQEFLNLPVQEFDLGGRHLAFEKEPHLMGVVNLSPGSWYRESVCLNAEAAIHRGLRLTVEGAHIIDVGAESTLAHTPFVGEDRQTGVLLPVIKALAEDRVLVSVETYHPSVAEVCLDSGASILNLTGTTKTDDIFRIVAERNAGVIICYVEGDNVRSVSNFSFDEDIMGRMEQYFARKIEEATKLGVQRIIIDPGLGFYYKNLADSAVRVRHQMKVFLETFRLRKLGWPVCHALPHAFEYFEDEVRCAESFFAMLALLGKTNLLRTHEVPKVRAVCRTMDLWT